MSYYAFFLALAILSTSILAYVVTEDTACTTLYFLNAVFISSTNLTSNTLYIETPINLTDYDLHQEVRLVLSRGVHVDSGGYYVRIDPGNPTYAYVLMEVTVCSRSYRYGMNIVKRVLADPESALQNISGLVKEVPKDFVGRYPEDVATLIREDFEAWLKNFNWYQNKNVSTHPLIVSVFGAYFIYLSNYIKYSANLTPRSLSEVISRREGDCDDMSRLLLVLLWSYDVPALMLLGYVSIPSFNMRTTLGNFEYVFLGGGPHAFVEAYVQGYGWLSLDFLAGSLLTYPFIVWDVSKDIEVSPESVEEFLELHESISGKQLIAAVPMNDPIAGSAKALEEFINTTLSITGSVVQPQEEKGKPLEVINMATPVTAEQVREVGPTLLVLLFAVAAATLLFVIIMLLLSLRSLKEVR